MFHNNYQQIQSILKKKYNTQLKRHIKRKFFFLVQKNYYYIKLIMQKLQNKWTFWENIKNTKDKQFHNAINKLYTFSDLTQFAAFWNHPNSFISNLTNFFTTSKGNYKYTLKQGNDLNKQENNQDVQIIQTISLFKNEIKPMWEDEANMQGGQFFSILKINESLIDSIYQRLVFDLIGQYHNFSNNILGMRFHQRKKNMEQPNEINIKIEYWMDFNSKTNSISFNQIKQLLQNYLKSVIKEIYQTKNDNNTLGQAINAGNIILTFKDHTN